MKGKLIMKLFKYIFVLSLLFVSKISYAQVYVRGYNRANGTYVGGHYRSSPNASKLDNYSTKGNINPYTGQKGTKNPF